MKYRLVAVLEIDLAPLDGSPHTHHIFLYKLRTEDRTFIWEVGNHPLSDDVGVNRKNSHLVSLSTLDGEWDFSVDT